jgi:adenosine deaminase
MGMLIDERVTFLIIHLEIQGYHLNFLKNDLGWIHFICRGTYVAALDIAADKPGNVIDTHLPAFQYARNNGIPFTAHAGETRDIANVWKTLQHFAPSRLGHGVSSIQDPVLLEHLQQHNIHLEACPTCNVHPNCYNTYADLPINRLYQVGIPISVNTDTRTIGKITLSQECENR